jgi:hypothetical protein
MAFKYKNKDFNKKNLILLRFNYITFRNKINQYFYNHSKMTEMYIWESITNVFTEASSVFKIGELYKHSK